jgi:hypothetical protein
MIRLEPDRDPWCPSCGSVAITLIEWYGPTGVTSPDGGEECRMQYGIQCRECGRIEELE